MYLRGFVLSLVGILIYSSALAQEEILDTTDPSVAPSTPPKQSKSQIVLDSGQYLVQIAQCGSCHASSVRDPSSPLSGGFQIKDEFGHVTVPNITPSKKTGIGSWSIADITSAIRTSLGKDNKKLSISSHEGYRWMSDEDAIAIAKYLKSIKPVESAESDKRVLGSIATKSWGIINKHQELKGYVPAPIKSNSGYYGMYLVNNIMQCSRCHSPQYRALDESKYLAGGTLDWYSLSGEELTIPSIKYVEEGIGAWSEKEIDNFLQTGSKKNGVKVSGECPQAYFSTLTESDRKAIVNYLKSLK